MKHANYMVERMVEFQDNWTIGVDENGCTVIVNHEGCPCHGIKESDGTITSAEDLIMMYINRLIEKGS